MQLNPYLHFNGQCEEAFKFYEQALGGKITMMLKHGESPMAEQTPPELRDKVMHATLTVGDKVLMGADAPPQYYQHPQGFSVSLAPKELKDAERIYLALAEDGQIVMPLQKTFWSAGFGMLVDRFGIPWMVNCQQAA